MSTKISELEISKFQRISYAKITPSGNLIVLAGKNAQGKTTVLDAIESSICGHNGRNITRPIKDGAGKATISTKLDNGQTLIRKYTPSGTVLSGTDADGNKLGQADLNKMIGSLGIDASKFATIGEKEQRKTLLGLVELDFDPAELEAERKRIFDGRTAVSRRVKELAAQASSHLAFPVDHPTEEVSVAELITEHSALQSAVFLYEQCQRDVAETVLAVEHAERQLTAAREHAAKVKAYADTLTVPGDLTAIKSRIDNAEKSNAAARTYQAAQTVKAELAVAQNNADALTADLEAIDKRKLDGLAAAADQMPVEGLSFDDEGVLYQGVPFNRASGAEKIIVSAAMIIATDPELRTMVVRNGNELDAEHLQILQDMGDDNDFQIFIEIVADGADHEFTLVDGELAA